MKGWSRADIKGWPRANGIKFFKKGLYRAYMKGWSRADIKGRPRADIKGPDKGRPWANIIF